MTQNNSHFRTMHEVEVIYLKDGIYESRKFAYYLEDEAVKIYQRTINKFKEIGNAIVTLRDEQNTLLKIERFNPKHLPQ